MAHLPLVPRLTTLKDKKSCKEPLCHEIETDVWKIMTLRYLNTLYKHTSSDETP